MPRVTWPLLNDRPSVRIDVVSIDGQSITTFDLHADTGAGAASSAFDLIMLESDCWSFGNPSGSFMSLTGAYAGGTCWLFHARVQISALSFTASLTAVGVPAVPDGFRGVAGFRLLNRFDYGNFGNPAQFGLER
jgi:hypothetical protein